MSATARPRRSVLYMPGANPRALEKAKSLPADALVFDLEDSVAPDAKAEARDRVVGALKQGGYGARELVVRTNGLDTAWGHADLVALATAGADAVLLPKVEGGDTVRSAARILERAGAPASLAIWCMVETPRAVLRAEDIASAHPRMACLVMGTSDLAKDLGAAHTPMRLPMLTSLGLCILAARACGLAVLDGVHLDLNDDEGFAESCRQGAELGFDGRTLIHPKTLAAANAAYGPDRERVAWSRRIIKAHDDAMKRGEGLVVVDGKLVESLHVEEARRTVALARAVAKLEKQSA
ncbi:MAG: CoA ester lyase [Acetobacterales bacterium]